MIAETQGISTLAPTARTPQRAAGAMVISLDFELHWGVRDFAPLDRTERERLLVARRMVERILAIFAEYRIHATWATVGLLFATSREEAAHYRPSVLPSYSAASLNPYLESLGRNEAEDPFHFAPSLIEMIRSTPGQEVGSHSYSHYYCLEDGQSLASFSADLESAVAIGHARGITVESYVFPRNQVIPAYLPALAEHGIAVYRGAGKQGPYQAVNFESQRRLLPRALRMADTLVDLYGPQAAGWPIPQTPSCMEPSRYLQRCRKMLQPFQPLQLRRLQQQMQAAAVEAKIFHLWWHPEDFTTGGETNLDLLRRLLDSFSILNGKGSMESLSMIEALRRSQSKRNDERA